MDIENKRTWQPCFTLEEVKLPTGIFNIPNIEFLNKTNFNNGILGYFLGVSAATGDLSDNHDIHWIKTYDLGGSQQDASYLNVIPSIKNNINLNKSKSSSKPTVSNVKIFFFILLALVVIGFLLVLGKYFYEKYQRESIKRLY